jgi:hypothetical protein
MCESDQASITREILSYLLTHRMAEDTIEGIVDWWLLEERIRYRTREVQTVLDKLVEENLVLMRSSRDSKVRYGINDQKINEIRDILKSEEKEPTPSDS